MDSYLSGMEEAMMSIVVEMMKNRFLAIQR